MEIIMYWNKFWEKKGFYWSYGIGKDYSVPCSRTSFFEVTLVLGTEWNLYYNSFWWKCFIFYNKCVLSIGPLKKVTIWEKKKKHFKPRHNQRVIINESDIFLIIMTLFILIGG